LLSFCVLGLVAGLLCAAKEGEPLEARKPKCDPGGDQYTYLLANSDTPIIEGISVSDKIRDNGC
jgi:hypothetical protein